MTVCICVKYLQVLFCLCVHYYVLTCDNQVGFSLIHYHLIYHAYDWNCILVWFIIIWFIMLWLKLYFSLIHYHLISCLWLKLSFSLIHYHLISCLWLKLSVSLIHYYLIHHTYDWNCHIVWYVIIWFIMLMIEIVI